MLFKFECPRCGQHVSADTSEEGRQGPCPNCELLLTIPENRSFVKFSAAPYREQRSQERRFSSYDECPAIYCRFNGKQEYGPYALDGFVSFFAQRSEENIEGRFEDEQAWRPLSYFLELWDQVPPSGHTIKRLNTTTKRDEPARLRTSTSRQSCVANVPLAAEGSRRAETDYRSIHRLQESVGKIQSIKLIMAALRK